MAIQNDTAKRILGIMTWEAVGNAIRQSAANWVRSVLSGLERQDGPCEVEETVDLIARYEACPVRVPSKRVDVS